MCAQGLAKPPVVKLVQIAPFVLSVLNDTSYRLRASSAKMHRFVLRLTRSGLAHPSRVFGSVYIHKISANTIP